MVNQTILNAGNESGYLFHSLKCKKNKPVYPYGGGEFVVNIIIT